LVPNNLQNGTAQGLPPIENFTKVCGNFLTDPVYTKPDNPITKQDETN